MDKSIIDVSQERFLGAATLLPLLAYMKNNNINRYIPNDITKPYFDRVLGRTQSTYTTIPLKEIPKNVTSDEDLDVYEDIKYLLNVDYFEKNSFEYLTYETITNITKHSKHDHAYVLAQQYPKNKVTDCCFVDDGISIPGSFKNSNYNFKFNDDADAIYGAINGSSTSYEGSSSGKGMNTSGQLSSKGLNGEMLVASKEGLCHITSKGAHLFKIEDYYVSGTFVSIRIKDKIKIEDFSDTIKKVRHIKKLSKGILN